MFVKRVWQRFQVSPGAVGKAVREAGKVGLSARKEPVVLYGKQTNGRLREAISHLARPIFILSIGMLNF